MAKYTTDVAGLYRDMKPNEIPPAWKSLTLDKVKEDVKELYKL